MPACFGCKCASCGNSQEQYPYTPGECDFFCYNCTECMDGKKHGWTKECPRYKVSEHIKEMRARAEEQKATKRRSALAVVDKIP